MQITTMKNRPLVCVYFIKNYHFLDQNKGLKDFKISEISIGYSSILEVIAIVILYVNMIIGLILGYRVNNCLGKLRELGKICHDLNI
jgi:hypothetical protein